MADDSKKQDEEIQGILSDLDDILSDLGSAAEAPPKSVAPPPAPSQQPVVLPQPVVSPQSVVPPPQAAPPPPAAPAQESSAGLKIELSSRDGIGQPPPKKAEPVKPVEIPKAVAAHKPEEAPKPAEASPSAEAAQSAAPPSPAAPPPEEIPANTPKDQIRRVAYIHTFSCVEAERACAVFLSQAARTISKKPIFLREVLSLEVSNSSDVNAAFEKVSQAKAVVVLAVTEGWPSSKGDELSAACSAGGVLFRSVAPGDVQKKATAVDVIVDMMLLSGES